MSVDSGDNSLSTSFFVAGSTVNLTRKVQVFNIFQLKSGLQLRRIEIIIFNSVGRFEYFGILQPFYGVQSIQLDIQRKRRRETLEIIFIGVTPLWFEEKLMRVFVRENPKLVFDAWAVPRTTAGDHSGEHRRILEARPQDVVNFLVRVKDEARHLTPPPLCRRRNIKIREFFRLAVAKLLKKSRSVNRRNINSRRSPRLHPTGPKTKTDELLSQSMRRQLPYPASLESCAAYEHPTIQERSGGQNNRPRFENCPGICLDSADFRILKEERSYKIGVNI